MDRLTRDEFFTLLGAKAAETSACATKGLKSPMPAPGTNVDTSSSDESERVREAKDHAAGSSEEDQGDYPAVSVSTTDVFRVKCEAHSPSGWQSEGAHAYHVLTHSVPRVWRYALTHCKSNDARSLRKKLRELLVWLFTKEGFKTVAHAPAPYQIGGREIAGRIDLLVLGKADEPLLAIEADWTKDEASVCKLRKLADRHIGTAWLIGANVGTENLPAWRKFADMVGEKPSKSWLKMVHLEHGAF